MLVRNEFLLVQKNDKFYTPSYLTEYIYRKVNLQNKNFLCLIHGPPRSGKSYSCLTLASCLDKDFTADRIVFNTNALLLLIKDPKKYGLRRGSVIVFEEAGVAASSRRSMSSVNQTLLFLMQTFGCKNYIVFFNTPQDAFLDSGPRSLLHCTLTTQMILPDEKKVKLGITMNAFDSRLGRYVPRKFKVYDARKGGTVRCDDIKLGHPPKELLKQYEAKKELYVDTSIVDWSNKLVTTEGSSASTQSNDIEIILEINAKYESYKDRTKAFKKRTGKSRATYDRILAKIPSVSVPNTDETLKPHPPSEHIQNPPLAEVKS